MKSIGAISLLGILFFAAALILPTALTLTPPHQVNTSVDGDAVLKSLYDSHQWFKLRDAIRGQKRQTLYYGAVAAAFNDFPNAERILQSVIESGPNESADDARGILISLYGRAGRYRQALAQIEKALAVEPDNASLRNIHLFFASLSQAPQTVAKRRFSRISFTMKAGNMFIPASINGQPADYMVDTGANFSTISETEAKRVGLTVIESTVAATDAAGGQARFRIGFADRLNVGDVTLRHVAFLLARDDQEPFVELKPGERGVIGLPVLLAFQTMRWKHDGTFEIAFALNSKPGSKPNMCFEGTQPVIEGEFRQHYINMFFDTGAVHTRFLPQFARDFADFLKEAGRKDSVRVSGIGNQVDVDAITLPELSVRLSAFDATLRPAQILLKETSPDSRWWHVWAGLDLINQAHVVTLDFPNMTVNLE